MDFIYEYHLQYQGAKCKNGWLTHSVYTTETEALTESSKIEGATNTRIKRVPVSK